MKELLYIPLLLMLGALAASDPTHPDHARSGAASCCAVCQVSGVIRVTNTTGSTLRRCGILTQDPERDGWEKNPGGGSRL